MSAFIEPIGRLINQFTKLPGVGAKTAQRYADNVINMTEDEVTLDFNHLLAGERLHFVGTIVDVRKSFK